MPKFGFLLSPVTGAVAAHGGTHVPGGADALTTAAPPQGIGGSNAEGVAASFARSDHDHTLRETGGPQDLTLGAIPDGQFLQRSGNTIVGGLPAGGGAPSITEAVATPYALLVTDEYVLVNPAVPAPFVVNLPAGATHNTKVVTVKDKTGTAAVNNITINANGAETIDGAGSNLLVINHESVTLVFSGTEWSIV